MKTEVIMLMEHSHKEFTPVKSLEMGSFYIIKHTEIVGGGHQFVELLVFVDAKRNVHPIAHPEYSAGKCWDENSSLDVVRKLDKITFSF